MQDKNKGILYALAQSFLWSQLPVLAILAFRSVDTRFTLAVVTTIAGAFYSAVLTWRRAWHELKIRQAYPYILGNTIFSAFLFFGLMFWGTSMTSAGNAAIILRMENFFAIAILGGIGFDRITKRDVIGGVLMITGAAIILVPDELQLNKGDAILLIAAVFPVIGNACSKKARQYVSSATILFLRTVLSMPAFWMMAASHGSFPDQPLSGATILALFFNGFMVIGIGRILWIEAIHLIPVSTANSISSIHPVFTVIAAYFVLGEYPTIRQLTALLPMIVGLNLLVRQKKLR